MTDLARYSLTFDRDSALPEDRVVWSFWWAMEAGWDAADLVTIGNAVIQFVTEDNGATSSDAVELYLASSLATSANLHVHTYDMATGNRLTFEGDGPQLSVPFTIAPGATSLPAELAVCLSFRNTSGTTPAGGTLLSPQARRRGRVYIGPLAESALSVTQVEGGDRRPLLGVNTIIRENAAHMRGLVLPGKWVVYSRPFAGRGEVERPGRPTLPAIPARAGTATVVESCWTDDAFDIQRRRGGKRTARVFG